MTNEREIEIGEEVSAEIEASEEGGAETESREPLEIPRVDAHDYATFFERFMSRNRPCVVCDVTRDWECARAWVGPDDVIDHAYLSSVYGSLPVRVTECRARDVDAHASDSTLADYMRYLSGEDGTRREGRCLYLKDWHLRRCRPRDPFYTVPELFASDWLNEYSIDNDLDDFMFVYIGPEGSWTPLHVDVYSSFSWSVNVSGRKRWVLLAPGEEAAAGAGAGDEPAPGPRVARLLQRPGDAVFVPSGWHHVVRNELDTISVNHNWINGCNALRVWRSLRAALAAVERELSDLRGEESFARDCQRVLAADVGIDCERFADLVTHVGGKRLAGAEVAWGRRLGPRHRRFDLRAVAALCDALLADDATRAVLSDARVASLTELRRDVRLECGDSTRASS